MGKSKIEWCDETFNPITGCRHSCEYCYAKQMTRRFSGDVKRNLTEKEKFHEDRGGYVLDEPFVGENGKQIVYPFGFEPTLHRYRMDMPDKFIAGRNIFVGAMADMFGEWVPDEWIREVFASCQKFPQHNYMFLTKNPARYLELKQRDLLPEGDSFWYGTTVTDETKPFFFCKGHKTFLSIEPILGKFTKPDANTGILDKDCRPDWIIIGAETGLRKGKIVPEFEWIKEIVLAADLAGIPVFMKDSLIPIVGEKNMRREFPKELLSKRVGEKRSKIWFDSCHVCKTKMDKQKMVTISGKVTRQGAGKTLFHMCRDCYEKWCEDMGIEGYTEELYEEKKLQKDGGPE